VRLRLAANSLSKSYDGHLVFEGVGFDIRENEGLVIAGANGSGKSTLIKILCGLVRADSGGVVFEVDEKEIPMERRRLHFGLVSSEFQLYDELTARENYVFFRKLRYARQIAGSPTDGEGYDVDRLLMDYGLGGRGDDRVGSFSSGMKQRLRYMIASSGAPDVLLLDEPTSNLDDEGIAMVDRICSMQKENGILVVATNDKRDYRYGEKTVRLTGRGSRVDR
jgi:heme exporter protein A